MAVGSWKRTVGSRVSLDRFGLPLVNLDSLLTHERVVRMLADAVMVNIALWAAFALPEVSRGLAALVGTDLRPYLPAAPILTLVSLPVFYANGFYTRGRAYRRWKGLLILHAVSLAYALFAALFLLVKKPFPLPQLLAAWMFTVCLLELSRLWSFVWTRMARLEGRAFQRLPAERKVLKVLVIGGAGYIGSALLAKLLGRGYRVRLLDLLLFGEEPIQDVLDHPNLEVIRADFRDAHRVVEAMQGMDAVVHLGGIVGDPACALDEELTIEINLMATRMIAQVAKGSGVQRFVFASTCSVYGANGAVLDEGSILNPISLYARSKVASEKVLMGMRDQDFAPVVLRFSTIYGLSGRTRFDLVVNLLTAQAIVDNRITVFGGDQWRPFLHVDDAALSVLKAIEAPLAQVNGQVFNVGFDEQNYTIEQVGEIIHRMVPTAELTKMSANGDRRSYRVSFRKIRQTLNFEPQWTLEAGMRQVVEAIRSGRVVDYRDPKYSNVKFLTEERHLIAPTESLVRELLEPDHPTPLKPRMRKRPANGRAGVGSELTSEKHLPAARAPEGRQEELGLHRAQRAEGSGSEGSEEPAKAREAPRRPRMRRPLAPGLRAYKLPEGLA